jgi:TonB family protein
MMNSRALVVLVLLGFSWTVRAEVSFEAFQCPEGDSEHVPLHRSPPVWPHVATMMCLEGTVVLEFTVASSGLVKDARVVEADQPGIFDRAAINATRHWLYQPRCEGGSPVEAQQRTALDFFFDSDEERERCLPGAALLEGEALQLASSLGLLYSMLAEWHLSPNRNDWPEQIQSALVPGFDGDLGRIERFHHEFIAQLLTDHRHSSLNEAIAHPPRLIALQDKLDEAMVPLTDEVLTALVELFGLHARFQAQSDRLAELAQRLSRLEAEVDLDPALFDVLVHPFVGDPGRTADNGAGATDPGQRLEEVIHLLEDSVGQWQWRSVGEGIQFERAEDQALYERLLAEALKLHLERRESLQRFMMGFMDYRM